MQNLHVREDNNCGFIELLVSVWYPVAIILVQPCCSSTLRFIHVTAVKTKFNESVSRLCHGESQSCDSQC